MTNSKWYVLKTHSLGEYFSANALIRDGFKVEFPRVRSERPRLGHEDVPLFPGYLFLNLDDNVKSTFVFNSKYRLMGFVTVGDEIPWLSDEVMSYLVGLCHELDNRQCIGAEFSPGDQVKVDSGLFRSLALVSNRHNSSASRVKVLMDFMGQQVLADVPYTYLSHNRDEGIDKSVVNVVPRRTRGKRRWIRGYKN